MISSDNRSLTYSQYVELVLNSERIRIRKLVDLSEAVAIGRGDKMIPDSWIDTITDDPEVRAQWKRQEFRKLRTGL